MLSKKIVYSPSLLKTRGCKVLINSLAVRLFFIFKKNLFVAGYSKLKNTKNINTILENLKKTRANCLCDNPIVLKQISTFVVPNDDNLFIV